MMLKAARAESTPALFSVTRRWFNQFKSDIVASSSNRKVSIFQSGVEICKQSAPFFFLIFNRTNTNRTNLFLLDFRVWVNDRWVMRIIFTIQNDP